MESKNLMGRPGFYRLTLGMLTLLTGVVPVALGADLQPGTVLATSSAGEIAFADVAEKWPYMGSDAEKLRVVREALKDRIFAREAESARLDTGPQVEKQSEEAQLSAGLEALFVREKGEPEISDEDLKAYYEENKDLYFLDEHIYLRHIALDIPSPSDETSRLETKTRAIEALARLRAGEPFSKVCRQYTSDTLYGPLRIGPVPAQDIATGWGQKVVELEPGQRSDVIELPLRFEIVELLERHPTGYLPFEQVRPAVRSVVFREKRREAQAEFITESMNSLKVEIDHRAIADPGTKPGKVVIETDGFKMNREEYDRWAAQQPFLSRHALRNPRKRETIVRRNLMLRHWVERQARKEKLEKEPAFQAMFERQRRRILAKAFEDYLFAQNPSFLEVTDDDIQQHYASHLYDFRTPERAEIRDIIVKADTSLGNTPEARALAFRYAMQQAKEVLQKLEEGNTTFKIAALQYGSTGDPEGFFRVDRETQGELFDEVVFALKPGEITEEPLVTDEGYRIVQMNQTIPAVQLPLAEVRERIVEKLGKEKADRLRGRLEEQYFDKAHAQVFEERFLQGLTD